MSTPNPLTPHGSLLEQQSKGRSTFHVISFIGIVHIMLLCGILWTACGRDEKQKEPSNTLGTDPYGAPPTEPATGLPPAGGMASNLASSLPLPTASPSGNLGAPLPTTGAGDPTTAPGTGYGTTAPPALPPGANLAGYGAPTENLPSTIASGEYKVAKGDIGSSIARKHGVSLKALVEANPGVTWNRLKIGQSVQIPAGQAPGAAPAGATATADGVIYRVKAGDTGTKIAAKYGVKWTDIRRASKLRSDSLRPGQKLTIPGQTGAGANTPPPGGGAQPIAIPVPRDTGQ